jgi:hypothetical protein
MKRAGQVVGGLLVLLGLFWAGRESDHGFGAFWEHWWCPLPLAAIIIGLLSLLAFQRPTPTT